MHNEHVISGVPQFSLQTNKLKIVKDQTHSYEAMYILAYSMVLLYQFHPTELTLPTLYSPFLVP